MPLFEDVSWRRCQLTKMSVGNASWICQLLKMPVDNLHAVYHQEECIGLEPKTQWTKLKSTNSVMCSLQHCQDMRSKRFTAFLKADANHAYITFANQDKSTLQSRTIFLYKPLVSFCRRRDFISPLKWSKMNSLLSFHGLIPLYTQLATSIGNFTLDPKKSCSWFQQGLLIVTPELKTLKILMAHTQYDSFFIAIYQISNPPTQTFPPMLPRR